MDTGTESRYSLIQRRENIARQAFIDAVCLIHDYRPHTIKPDIPNWQHRGLAEINFLRQELIAYCQRAQDAYNEVKELAIAIGNASKAGYTAFWLREIKRLQEDCENEWNGKTDQERSARATGAHDNLYGGVK